MMTTAELKNRIEAKKLELQSRLATLKADTRAEAQTTTRQIKDKLTEVEIYLKEGWEKVAGPIEVKLHEWLKKN